MIACTSKEGITPTNSIVGKWAPTYLTQSKQANGTFGAWGTIATFAPLPVYEFTNDGRFLRDGKPGGACCASGNKYSVAGSKIKFDELPDVCLTARCTVNDWIIIEIKGDTLILEEYYARNKYVRNK